MEATPSGVLFSTAGVRPMQRGSACYLAKSSIKEYIKWRQAGSIATDVLKVNGATCRDISPLHSINREVHPESLSGIEHNCADHTPMEIYITWYPASLEVLLGKFISTGKSGHLQIVVRKISG